MKKTMWRKVKVPKPWRPSPGDELIGEYTATEIKSGEYGEYQVHHVKSNGVVLYVTGSMASALFAVIGVGTRVKVVFKGYKKCADMEREYKDYELYTEG